MNFVKRKYRKLGYEGKYLDIRYKEFKKQTLISSIILFLAIVGVSIFFYINFYTDYISGEEFSFLFNPYMKSISYLYKSDDITQNIAIVCDSFEEEEKKIICVNNFVDEFYDYDIHQNEVKIFRTPEEILNKGGCCRDYSVFYSSILSILGFDYDFVFEPNHVYVEVYGEENDYELDMDYLKIN